jgi:hypothetical protein
VPLRYQKIQQKTNLATEGDNMYILASYFMGIIVGMLLMASILKSRIFYHFNTLDWFTSFKNQYKGEEKLKWML